MDVSTTNIYVPLSLTRLLVNNTGYFILLLLGFFSFNISSYPLVAYNSYFWGVVFKTALCKTTLTSALSLFLPHIFFEVVWILIATTISTQFSLFLYEEFNNMYILKFSSSKILKNAFLGFLILIVGVLVEFYITNKF